MTEEYLKKAAKVREEVERDRRSRKVLIPHAAYKSEKKVVLIEKQFEKFKSKNIDKLKKDMNHEF